MAARDSALDESLLTPCGEYCGFCPHLNKERTPFCPGCDFQKGQPFHGTCKVYFCAKEHAVEHCGLCTEFPCDLFIGQYDPRQGQRSALTRAGLLAYRKKAGPGRFVEMTKKLSDEETKNP